jgi:hypothetical protein
MELVNIDRNNFSNWYNLHSDNGHNHLGLTGVSMTFSILREISKHKKQFMVCLLSLFLLLSSLYQLEIIVICLLENRLFDLPFYISDLLKPYIPPEQWNWFWRDFFYALIVFSYVLMVVALWYWE